MSTILIILWLGYIVLGLYAIYQNWKKKNRIFFYLTYIYLALGFGALLLFGNPVSPLNLILQLAVGLFLTIFLQLSVWWFTHKWHRK